MTFAAVDRLDAVVSRLQQQLDETIRQIAGPDGLAAVAGVRELAQALYAGQPAALPELTRRLAELTSEERRVVARAFSIFLDLTNVAEDRHRVRILRERKRHVSRTAGGVHPGRRGAAGGRGPAGRQTPEPA